MTGRAEIVAITTITLSDGRLLYMVGVAPQAESRTYQNVFRRIRQEVRISR